MENQSRIFKVVVLFQEKDEVFYTKIKITDGVPASLLDIICARYPSLLSLIKRCYVNDKSGAEFSIINNDDLAVFLEGEELFENVVRVEINGVNREPQSPETPPKRVRIEEQQATPSTAAINPDSTPKEMHENVICDCCDEIIAGFRYKCTECFNFDLCMTCEGKMRHREHIMIRIPSPSVSPVLSPQRAMKWAYKKCQETAQPGTAEHEKSRRHHHGKRHHRRCQRGQNGMFDGFFRQLNEESPVSDPDIDVLPQEGAQPADGPQRASSGPHPPMYDYQKLVKGVETVAGMVSKLFDPLGISLDTYADYGVNVPPTTAPTAAPTSTTTPAASPQPTASSPYKTPEKQPMEATDGNKQAPSVTSIETIDSVATPAQSAVLPEPSIIDIEEDTSNQSAIIHPTTDSMPMSPFASNNSEDNEWLVISSEGLPDNSLDQNKATQVTPRKESLPSTSSSSVASTSVQTTVEAAASVATASAQTQGYDELARKLQKDIEEQLRINSSTAGTQTSMPPTAPMVYHPVPHINMSIVRMMDMGFSNDGGCLTELMACCNGDIRRALDSLLYKK